MSYAANPAPLQSGKLQHLTPKVDPEASAAGAAAAGQAVARKTVSSKSTPNDDASEASTNEAAAVSDLATPSPNEEFPSAHGHSYLLYRGPHGRSLAWQSPLLQPHGTGKSPAAEDLSPTPSSSRAVCASKGATGMPALVASGSEAPTPPKGWSPAAPDSHMADSSALSTRPAEEDIAVVAVGREESGRDGGVAASEADTVAARLHQNLGIEATSGGGTATSSSRRAAAAAAAGSDDAYILWLIKTVGILLPPEGREQLSVVVKRFGARDLTSCGVVCSMSPFTHMPTFSCPAPVPCLMCVPSCA